MPFSLDIIKHNEFYFNDYAQIKAKGHSPVPSIIYPLSCKKLLLRLYKLQICWLERHSLFLRPTSSTWSTRLKSWYTSTFPWLAIVSIPQLYPQYWFFKWYCSPAMPPHGNVCRLFFPWLKVFNNWEIIYSVFVHSPLNNFSFL